MGIVHPDRVATEAGARPGDVLVLTKPLGVGIITTALKGEVANPAHMEVAVKNMKKLNRSAARLMQAVGVDACTDITGFAPLGHAQEMAALSEVRIRFHLGKLPFLEGAKGYAEDWLFPAGTCNNQRAYEHAVHFAPEIPEEMQQLLYTPETSGGLLVAIPPERLERLTDLFIEEGEPLWGVGEVMEGEVVEVVWWGRKPSRWERLGPHGG